MTSNNPQSKALIVSGSVDKTDKQGRNPGEPGYGDEKDDGHLKAQAGEEPDDVGNEQIENDK